MLMHVVYAVYACCLLSRHAIDVDFTLMLGRVGKRDRYIMDALDGDRAEDKHRLRSEI